MRSIPDYPTLAVVEPLTPAAPWPNDADLTARSARQRVQRVSAGTTIVSAEPRAGGDISRRFGSRLRTLRASRHLTQQAMARSFGIDRSFISDVERGRKSVSLVTLEVLALGLGVSLSELLSDV